MFRQFEKEDSLAQRNRNSLMVKVLGTILNIFTSRNGDITSHGIN